MGLLEEKKKIDSELEFNLDRSKITISENVFINRGQYGASFSRDEFKKICEWFLDIYPKL